ncbi:UvrD-helicase domain-containing protein [Candidatus Peregrinibacteria bacterium]|nr:UvrD-helicase domain-containing protein [Candidatus Peregrinibacteria bacterium]
MIFLNELNDRQREAAETLKGPLLIVAGAGSGKTRALTYRIANLIKEGVAKPWQILAVTFTNKAAGEMKGRIEKLLSENFEGLKETNRPTIGTFHAVCVRILRKHFDCFGREKSFVIYDDTDSQSLMRRVMKEMQMDDEKIAPRAALSLISRAKNTMAGPDVFHGRAANFFEKQVAMLYFAYEKRLKANNALDFDDLLLYTVRLFKEHPDVLDEYQEKWRFINVDEYQDTNHVQYVLTKLLADKYRNLCVIGDSDQSIYGFRGADISNILDFEKDYSEAKIIKLEQNYRSTQPILDAADSIIGKNKKRPEKKMWTEQKGGDALEVWHVRSEYEEAEKVAGEIERLMGEKVRLKDIVVLYRTNAQSRVVEEMFLKYGLPYKVIGGVKFYARKEIKDLLAYLRIIHNPNDTDSLLRVINVPPRRIGEGTVQKLQAFALARSLTLAEVLKHVEMVEELGETGKASLTRFWDNVTKWKELAKQKEVSYLIKQMVRDIDYKGFLMDGTEEGEMRYENVLELITVAGKYDGLEPEVSLSSFLEEVALVADTDQLKDTENVVTLMTLHSVKGLEYPYVFIVGCEENIFPHSRTLLDEAQLEEERRLMYVGVTRAMKKLYLLAAKQRNLYGNYQNNPLSRFIYDIPEHLVVRSGWGEESAFVGMQEEQAEEKTPKRPKIAEEKFKDGDHVIHATFGEGVVVERRGDLVTVAFKDKAYGIKKFAANIAPLEKVD